MVGAARKSGHTATPSVTPVKPDPKLTACASWTRADPGPGGEETRVLSKHTLACFPKPARVLRPGESQKSRRSMPFRPHSLTSARCNRKSMTRAGHNDLLVGSQPVGCGRAAQRELQGRDAKPQYLRSPGPGASSALASGPSSQSGRHFVQGCPRAR